MNLARTLGLLAIVSVVGMPRTGASTADVKALSVAELSQIGITVEVSRQDKPFPAITIVVHVGQEPKGYAFTSIQKIVAKTRIEESHLDIDADEIENNEESTERDGTYSFVGDQRQHGMLVFCYDTPGGYGRYCLLASSLMED
jgi:hypothetical protein